MPPFDNYVSNRPQPGGGSGFRTNRGIAPDRNGDVGLSIADNSPLYIDSDGKLALRVRAPLVLATGSPVALSVSEISSDQVRDSSSSSSTSVTGSIRRLSAIIAALQAQVAAIVGATWTETEIDFGSTPVASASFTITDALVTTTSKVVVIPSGNAPTGGYSDAWQWDTLQFAATPGTGEFTLHVSVANGTTSGKRKVYYQVA